MKHAGSQALDQVETLLAQIRRRQGLTERRRGVFYRGSKALLHFHEDPAGMFADLKVSDDWERFAVNGRAAAKALLARLDTVLAG